MKRRDVLKSISATVPVSGCLSAGREENVCEGSWVSFYGLGGKLDGRIWTQDTVVIGYTVQAGDALFVVYEGDSILGVNHVEVGDNGRTADGDVIQLNSSLEGEHTIRVVLYDDVNGNGEFDPSTDAQCHKDGEPIQAGPRTINFSKFTDGSPQTTT